MPPPALDDLSRTCLSSRVSHHANNCLKAIYAIEVEVGDCFAKTTEVPMTFNETGIGGGSAKSNVAVILASCTLRCC